MTTIAAVPSPLSEARIVAAECRHEAEQQAAGRGGEHRALGENAERP